ncbi:hypothetical protein CF161_02771 [Pseudomonas sp. CF161]|nr:hypothetical protein CF161_02771 [Pseudomonas sp. CF161]
MILQAITSLIAVVLQIVPNSGEYKTIHQCLGPILGMLPDPVIGYAQKVEVFPAIDLGFFIGAGLAIGIQRSITEGSQRSEACGLFRQRTA